MLRQAKRHSLQLHFGRADHNYYMEQEWRVFEDVEFDIADVQCVIIPGAYKSCFEDDCPEYRGEIYPVG